MIMLGLLILEGYLLEQAWTTGSWELACLAGLIFGVLVGILSASESKDKKDENE